MICRTSWTIWFADPWLISRRAAISFIVTWRLSFEMASTAAMASGVTTRCAWPGRGTSVTDVFYSLKHNDSFILYLKLHKILATSFAVLPSSGPSENQWINLKIKTLCACCYIDIQFVLFFSLIGSHFTIVDQFLTIYRLVSMLCNATCTCSGQ